MSIAYVGAAQDVSLPANLDGFTPREPPQKQRNRPSTAGT